jgi:hypothetical protein
MVIKPQRDVEIIRQVIWIQDSANDGQQTYVIGRTDADAAVAVNHANGDGEDARQIEQPGNQSWGRVLFFVHSLFAVRGA